MSAGWSQNGRLLTDADGLGIVSNLCPCPAQWYIATYCPCEECGTPICRVGEPALKEDASEVLYAGSPLRFLRITAPTPDGENPTSPCAEQYTGGIDCEIVAVKHTAKPAPFACTLTAQAWVRGTKIGEWVKTGVSADEEVELGDDSTWDGGAAYAAMHVDNDCGAAGIYAVNLSVEYSAEGQETVRYTCRTGVRIFEPEQEAPWVGDVFVAPDWWIDDSWPTCAATTTLGARLSISKLLGPYDTEAEALAELEGPHAEIIAEWAAKCQCQRCEFVRDGHWTHEESDSGADYWVYDVCTTAGQDCAPGTGLNCWIKLTYSVQNWGDGWTVELKINGVDMGVEDGNTYTFYVPPCSTVEERLHVVGSGDIMVGFYAEELGQPDPCPYDKEAYPTLADYLESLEA